MKSLKKEIITIVALLFVAVIGTYIVNAGTVQPSVTVPVLENHMGTPEQDIIKPLENNDMHLLADESDYACTQCPSILWLKTTCNGDEDCEQVYQDAYEQCMTMNECN